MPNFKADPRGYAQGFLEQWNSRNADLATQSMAEDCVWEFTVGSDPAGTRYEGAAAIKNAFQSIVRTVPDLHYELVDCHAGDNHLVMEILVTGTNAETKAALRYQACDILMFRDGKVQAKRSYRKVVS
jgi:ketosteroid isomerase-like protein